MLANVAYNPDVLSCLANLSSDEVFTPPAIVNNLLDLLPSELWSDRNATFLDPGTKSGVFLREIAKRLDKGLEGQLPDPQQRFNHIFQRQLYALAITDLTALISRRSVYCSKTANGTYSICTVFDDAAGNIYFQRIAHAWDNGRCTHCGASKEKYGRGADFETHAYAFIHQPVEEIFPVKFDVIVGNPPYQLAGGAGGSSDSSIYHLFVEQALKLNPRFVSMIIPSRWLAGGRGLDEFRHTMLSSKQISHIVDYTQMSTAFPGVDFEGGVCYFLWSRDFHGDCTYTLHYGEEQQPSVLRDLGAQDIFVRDEQALAILEKIQAKREPTVDSIVSADTPFGLATNLSGWESKYFHGSVTVYLNNRGARTIGYIPRTSIRKNTQLIDGWKVFLPEAYGERGAIPAMVLGPAIIAPPKSVCTQTYLVAGTFKNKSEALSFRSYASTRTFRFLVSLRKITQHALRSTYSWVPQQTWDQIWTDADLYKKYGLSKDDISFIEANIRAKADNE